MFLTAKRAMLGFSFIPVLAGIICYIHFPDMVGMQWDLEGHANWTAPRAIFLLSLFISPLAAIFVLCRENRGTNSEFGAKILLRNHLIAMGPIVLLVLLQIYSVIKNLA